MSVAEHHKIIEGANVRHMADDGSIEGWGR